LEKKKQINVGPFLIKPNLVKNDIINFGLVQAGKLINNYIEIFNPSDKVLMVKLVLMNMEILIMKCLIIKIQNY